MASSDQEKIDVKVDLEDNLSRPAEEAARGVDNLGEEAKETDRRLKALQRQADRTGRSLELMAIKARAASMEFDSEAKRTSYVADELAKVDKQTKNVTDSTKKLGQETKKTSKETDKSNKGFKAFQRTLARVTGSARGLPARLMGIAKGLGAVWVVAAGGAAVQNVLSMVTALSSLASLAAFLPSAIGGLLAIFGTLAVATKGVSSVIGELASGKLDKASEGFKKLSPAAQDFVSDVADMIPKFKELQRAVQDKFFKPFAALTKPLLQKVIKPIQTGMERIATALGYATGDVMLFFQSWSGISLIKNTFKAGEDAINNLSVAVTPVLHGLSSVMAVVAPLWDNFTGIIGKLGGQFGKWLDEISRSGALKDWIDVAIAVMKQLWGIVVNVFGIIKGVIGAVGDGKGFSPLLTALEAINKWVNSDMGQSALQSFFAALGKLLPALTPMLMIVANAIGTILAPAIADIVTNLAPGFTVFLQALSDGLAAIGPYVGPLAKALSDLLIALAPLLPIIGKIAGLLIGYLSFSLQALAPIISVVVQALSTFLVPFLDATAQAFKMVEPYIPTLIGLFVQFGALVTPILQTIGQMLSDGLNKYLTELAGMLPTLMPLIMELITTLGDFFVQALEQVIPILPDLIKLMFQMMTMALHNAPTILKLAITLTNLAIALLPVLFTGTKLIILLIQIGSAVYDTAQKFGRWIGDIIDKVKSITGAIGDALSGAIDAFTKPFKTAYDRIVGIINDMKSAITDFHPGDLIGSAIDAINPFRFAGGEVASGQDYTVGEIGKEMYVPKFGTPEIIGEHGMETRSFPTDGMILPNYMLNAMERNEALMRKHAAAQEKMSLPSMGRAQQHNHYHNHEGDKIEATFTGDIHKDVDIERAMNRWYKNMKRDEAERR